MNNLEASYNKILETIKGIESRENYLHQIRRPRMSDIQLVSLALTAEYLGIDSEHDLFRRLPESLSTMIERSVYNKRRRKLLLFIESIRGKISKAIISDEE